MAAVTRALRPPAQNVRVPPSDPWAAALAKAGTILAGRAPMKVSERVVVVGTGPAAAAAAVVLSEAGLEPLLLEAGSASAGLGLTARVRGLTLAKVRPALTRRSDLIMRGDPRAELF